MADYYVASIGTSGAGTIGNPFGMPDLLNSTLFFTDAPALVALTPGDTLWFRGGDYHFNGAIAANVTLQILGPAVSGTALAPITMRAYPGETVNLYVDSGTQPVLGTELPLVNYCRFFGFTIHMRSPDFRAGGIHIAGNGHEIAYNEIIGQTVASNDNHDGIRVQYADGTWIHHNNVHDIQSTANPGYNSAALKSYNNGVMLVEDNYFHDNTCGVYDKDGGLIRPATDGFHQATYRRNYISNNTQRDWVGSLQGALSTYHVYDNVITGTFNIESFNYNSEVYNNLFTTLGPISGFLTGHGYGWNYGSLSDSQQLPHDNTTLENIWNNIVVAPGGLLTAFYNVTIPYSIGGAYSPLTYMDYNVYTGTPWYMFGPQSSPVTKTLAQMRADGWEVNTSIVSALTDVYVDLTSYVLKTPYQTAGRFGDQVGPRFSIPTIMDASRYGPQAQGFTTAGASRMGKNRLFSFGSDYVVWSIMAAGTPGPIPPTPSRSRPLLTLEQPSVLWSDAFRFGNLVPPTTFQFFEQALEAKLLSIPELAAFLGTSIYTQALPETHDLGHDGPALSYVVATKPRGHVLTGSDGTATARVQLDYWSYSYGTAKQALEATWNALDGLPQTWGDGTCQIFGIVQQDDIDASEQPRAGTDQWLYHLIQEYSVKYRVAVPTLS